MRRVPLVAATLGVPALIALQLVSGAAPASAHKHPTAISLDAPGVVFVQTAAHVDISLIESDTPTPGHIQLTRRTYDQVLAGGSGFAVNPNGYIVTSAGILDVDKHPAEIYAVNHLFSERYGADAPLPANEFATQHLAAGGRLDQRLQRCYQPNTTDVTGGCVMRTTLRVVVYPYVTSQTRYGALAAQVLTRNLTSSPDPDVAVLKVAATSMPTVKLAAFDVTKAKAPGGEIPGAVLGFTGVPGADHDLHQVNTHLLVKTGTAKSEDMKELGPMLTEGLRGGPIIANEQEVVGFYPWTVAAVGSPAGSAVVNPSVPKLVDGASITKVLDAAGVDARRGPTDGQFEDALHSFNNAEFSGSIPALRRTLELYAGHFKAHEDLTVALAKRGTAADLTGQDTNSVSVGTDGGGGSNVFVWVSSAVALLALVGLVIVLVLRRRGKAQAGAAAPARPATSPAADGGAAAPGRPSTAPRSEGSKGGDRGTGAPAAPAPRRPAPPARTTGGASGGASGAAAAAPAAGQPGTGAVAVRPSLETSAPADAKTFCTSCGQRLAPNHQFCGWCGHRVG